MQQTFYPQKQTLIELFAEQARLHPDAVAVSSEQGQMSYGELERRANQLAHYLRALGVGPEVLVGICMQRSVEMMVSLLGILKAGGAYVPLDPSYPQARLAFMLDDTRAAVLVTHSACLASLPPYNGNVINLDTAWPEIAQQSKDSPVVPLSADSLIYIIYTSGTTGRPKGVMVTHAGVTNYLSWASVACGTVHGGSVVHSSLSFDLTVTSLFTPLLVGDYVGMVEEALGVEGLAQAIQQQRPLGLLKLTPSHLLLLETLLKPEDLAHLEATLVIGGEPLAGSSIENWQRWSPRSRYINSYGPTETTVGCCVCEVPVQAEHPAQISIGRPIPNMQIYVLDTDLRPVPIGAAGELYIAGVGVARGYFQRPEVTAERFVPDPFSREPGTRMYRSGDRARYQADGTLEYLGRFDHQVKIRGFRIELGEIASVLRSQEEVQEAVVDVREVLPGEKSLVAYVLPRPGKNMNVVLLRQRLQTVLPHYMLPSFFVLLEALPLNANGKVDRRVLSTLEVVGADLEASYVAPQTPTEHVLSQIWSEVLGVARVGVDDDFFELGGHSLLAMIMLSRTREMLQVDLSLQPFFASRTIRQLAQALEALPKKAAEPALQPVSRAEAPLVSFAQQRLWFLDQLEPGLNTYTVPLATRLRGSLCWEYLRDGLSSLIERHEILRTTFIQHEGQARQRISSPSAIYLPLVDVSALPLEQREILIHSLAQQEAQRSFDLQQGPLLRALLIRLAPAEHLLVLSLHHIITDGWSHSIFWRELATAYAAAEQERLPEFSPLPVQYADYALWQRQWLSEERMNEHLAYWQQQLAGAPQVLELPTIQPRSLVQRHQGTTIRQQLPTTLHRQAQVVSQREGVTLFMTLLSAFALVIYRMSGQDDLLLGTVIAGRTHQELEGLIGFFANTLPLRCTFRGHPRSRDFLHQIREMALQAYAHQDVPFEFIVKMMQPERDLSRNPLVQVFFTFEDAPKQLPSFGTVTSTLVENTLQTTHFDLTLAVVEQQDDLWLKLEYDTDLFTEASMQRLLEHYQMVLESMVTDLSKPIAYLPWLMENERQQILEEWNTTSAPYPQKHMLGELFAQQAQAHPDAIAVSSKQGQMSYGELERRSNQLAHYLQRQGVGPETLVGICMERSLELIVGLLGILKAGGAYVPLDPSYPQERLRYIVQDAGMMLILACRSTSYRLESQNTFVQILCWEDLYPNLEQAASSYPQIHVEAQNLAYVIYTSGSTGKPKGVAIRHQSVVTLLHWSSEIVTDEDLVGIVASTSICFDLSVFELFVPLSRGGTVILVEDALHISTVAYERAVLINTVPSAARALLDTGGIPTNVRTVCLAGEPLSGSLVRELYQGTEVQRVYNLYGPSEDTTYSTYALIPPEEQHPPIGHPIANTRAYILDQQFHLVPPGATGDLYIAGAGLARGYLNRPAMTAEAFLPDPWGQEPGGRLYSTGDLARYRPDGTLEYRGRRDHQVKVRGFRIELGEIESVLLRQPEVQEAVVEMREVVPGEKSLVAYVILLPGQQIETSLLRQQLHSILPEYMIPSFFLQLDTLPLNANGKLNRRALPLPERRQSVSADGPVAPRTALEARVAQIWSEVLGVESIEGNENFFALGGHSLLATRVISRVHETFHVDIPLRTLFEAPVFCQFVERLNAFQVGVELSQAPQPGLADRQQPIPLSFAQQGLWFLDQMEPLNPFYNVATAIRLSGSLHLQALLDSLRSLLSRHEILRTRFVSVNGSPLQVIDTETELPVSLISLEAFPENERDASAIELANRAFHRPFDLASDRLLRGWLLRLSPGEHILVISLHHIITDGWSMGVFTQELFALYQAFSAGEPSPLPALPLQYGDYAAWQRQWLEGERLEKQVAYWRTQLAGAPSLLELPTDYPRPSVQSYHGDVHRFLVSKALTDALNTFSHQEGVTLFITLLAAFQILLARYSGQEDIVVGSPVANRTHSETEQLIGFFVNTLVLRTDLSQDATFQQILQQVRETCLDAYAHQDLPFEKLVEELQPARNLSYHPLFQVLFVLQNAPSLAIDIEGLQGDVLPLKQQTSKFDLNMSIQEDQDGLAINIGYNTDLFRLNTIEGFAQHFQTLLAHLVQHPTQPVSTLTLLPEEAYQQIVYGWNATATDFSTSCFLHQLVEAQVTRTPEAIAVTSHSQHITFAELNRRANGVARFLRAQGVGPDTLVGIYMERSLELVVGILGVLKAGGAYVPLDPNYPPGRLEYMITNSGMRVALTQRVFLARFANSSLQAIDVEAIAVPDQGDNPVVNISPDQLAYVIYTSGSTGHPKGAMNTHRAVSNRILWMQTEYHLDSHDRLLQKTPISFDVSVCEIFWPLIAGAALVMANPQGHKDPAYLRDVIQQADITNLHFVPSMLHIFLQEQGIEQCRSLRQVFCSGEALTIDDQNRFFTLFQADLNNLYGPTEAAVDVSFWHCQNLATQSVIPIGCPIANVQLYILDDSLHPVPPRVAGELYIGGRSVGRGYWQDPQKTAAVFIPNPFSSLPGERLYRTGDRTRYQPDGTIEFLGRVDYQVKLRGFRIELGEIEAVLIQHADIQNAALLAQDADNGEKYLVAYLVPEDKKTLAIPEIRQYLKVHLPEYMIPAFFVVLDALPLTANGKLDRRALPLPDRSQIQTDDTYVAPRTTVEKLIAQVWSEVLDVEHLGINDNFFELGGHSLLATRIMSRLREIFQRSLPLRYLFEYPDIASLAASIQREIHMQQEQQIAPLVSVTRQGNLPLSFAQQRLWFVQQLDTQSPVYNIYTLLRLKGPLNQAVLKQSLNAIIGRHEALRSIFVDEQDELSQHIMPELEFPFNVVRLPGASRAIQEKQADDIIKREIVRPFDLAHGPLFRGHLIVLDEQEHLLLLNMHHIISDGWSSGILMREITGLYTAFLRGSSSPLPPLPIQYADYAVWQREWLQGEALERQVAYWKKQLEGAPPLLTLPTDHPRPTRLSLRGTTFPFRLSAALSQQLKALGQREGVTLFMTLLAASQVLLARYSGQDDILVGTPIAGRTRSDLEELIGFFVNTLVLRTDLSGAPTFQQLLRQVREVVLAADSHQDLPFEKLVEILQPRRDPGYHPLFQVMFTLQSVSTLPDQMADIQITYRPMHNETAKFDLSLDFVETAQGLKGSLEYSTDLFTEARMRRMSVHLQTLLEAIVAYPARPLGELSLWSDTITLDGEELDELFDL